MANVDHSARQSFIQQWSHMGKYWIAEQLDLTPNTVTYYAFMYRISLKTSKEPRGRNLKATVVVHIPSPKGEVCQLPITHPVIEGIHMARGQTGKKELGTSQWKAQRKRVLQRDSYTCAYCGQEATQVDHIIPRVDGGTHDMDNLIAACAKCNGLKGSRSQASFLRMMSAPPVFIEVPSPTRSVIHQDSPFTAKPDPEQS
jgi:5-methylcytosine-specific restriction endonuclease McrA